MTTTAARVGTPPRLPTRLHPDWRRLTTPSRAGPTPATRPDMRNQVWRWLVQVGCLRAGFYSNDLLDNLAHPSAAQVIPQQQQLHIGQWVSMSPTPSATTAFTVDSYEQPRWLLWSKPDSTWVWTLTPTDTGATRLATRVHARYEWTRPASALLSVVLMEVGDFAMMRRMLLGIRQRAEAQRLSRHGNDQR